MSTTPLLRFAPSPNGRLHLGHAFSALLNAALAASMGGRFLVRIEDIDSTRCTPQLAEACLQDLAWLGLHWEEPVRVQSHHMADYAAALAVLHARGLIYPCFCSRSEVSSASTLQDPDGAPLYPGTCRFLAEREVAHRRAQGAPHCWRLDMEKALGVSGQEPLYYTRFTPFVDETEQVLARPRRWGDVVLARKETPTSYHLSVVVDDALQHITHVVRGRDLEAATCLHRLLQRLLDLPTPLYHHHELIRTGEGDKLSKSKRHETLEDLRQQGMTAEKIRQMLAVPNYRA